MHEALISTPVTRIIHAAVFKAVNSPLAPNRYKKKLTVMLEKGNVEHEEFRQYYLNRMREMVLTFPGGSPDLRAASFGDGDAPGKQGKNSGKIDPNTQGHWLLRPWCEPDAPLVLRYLHGVEVHEATSSAHVFSGCYGRTSMRMFIYTKGTPGLALGLSGFVKTKDGPRLDNSVSEDDVLAALGIKADKRVVSTKGVPTVEFPDITDVSTRAALGLAPL